MNKNILYLIVISALTVNATLCFSGEWSKNAVSLIDKIKTSRYIKIESPDRQKFLCINTSVEDRSTKLIMKSEEVELDPVMDLTEILWSSDSKAFSVTQSLGGAVGEWITDVYLIRSKDVKKINLGKEFNVTFNKKLQCSDSENVNVGFVSWLQKSQTALVLTEVPPHSTCKDMGKIVGYIIDFYNIKIIRVLNEKQIRLKYGKILGTRFN